MHYFACTRGFQGDEQLPHKETKFHCHPLPPLLPVAVSLAPIYASTFSWECSAIDNIPPPPEVYYLWLCRLLPPSREDLPFILSLRTPWSFCSLAPPPGRLSHVTLLSMLKLRLRSPWRRHFSTGWPKFALWPPRCQVERKPWEQTWLSLKLLILITERTGSNL